MRRPGLLLVALLAPALSLPFGCGGAPSNPAPPENPPVPTIPIEEAVDRHSQELIAIPGVTLVYVGAAEDGRPCIRVGFVSLPHENEARIPKTLEGWPVVIEATGEIRPLPAR